MITKRCSPGQLYPNRGGCAGVEVAGANERGSGRSASGPSGTRSASGGGDGGAVESKVRYPRTLRCAVDVDVSDHSIMPSR